jgi:hypothetical protein
MSRRPVACPVTLSRRHVIGAALGAVVAPALAAPLGRVRAGDIGLLCTAEVALAGRSSTWLIDSGATSAVIAARWATELVLPVLGRVRVATLGGVSEVERVRLPALELAGQRFEEGASALAVDLEAVFGGLGLELGGLLSAAQLRSRRLALDLGRGELEWLAAAPEGGAVLPIAWEGGLPIIELQLGGGERERFLLDSGNAGALVLFAHRARRLIDAHPGLPASRARELGGAVTAHHALIAQVRAPSWSARQVPVALETPAGSRRGGPFDRLAGSAGFALFEPARVTIDGPGSDLHVQGHSDAALPGGFGFAVAAAEGGLTVRAVIDDSPARAAGVAPGDRIVAIDGRPAPSLTPASLWAQAHGRDRLALDLLAAGASAPRRVELSRERFLPLLSI